MPLSLGALLVLTGLAGCSESASKTPYLEDLKHDDAAALQAATALFGLGTDLQATKANPQAAAVLASAARAVAPLAVYYNQEDAPAGHPRSSPSLEATLLMLSPPGCESIPGNCELQGVEKAGTRDCESYAHSCAPNVPGNLTRTHAAFAAYLNAEADWISYTWSCIEPNPSNPNIVQEACSRATSSVNTFVAQAQAYRAAAIAEGIAAYLGMSTKDLPAGSASSTTSAPTSSASSAPTDFHFNVTLINDGSNAPTSFSCNPQYAADPNQNYDECNTGQVLPGSGGSVAFRFSTGAERPDNLRLSIHFDGASPPAATYRFTSLSGWADLTVHASESALTATCASGCTITGA